MRDKTLTCYEVREVFQWRCPADCKMLTIKPDPGMPCCYSRKVLLPTMQPTGEIRIPTARQPSLDYYDNRRDPEGQCRGYLGWWNRGE